MSYIFNYQLLFTASNTTVFTKPFEIMRFIFLANYLVFIIQGSITFPILGQLKQ